jgi:hypothetical protein
MGALLARQGVGTTARPHPPPAVPEPDTGAPRGRAPAPYNTYADSDLSAGARRGTQLPIPYTRPNALHATRSQCPQ